MRWDLVWEEILLAVPRVQSHHAAALLSRGEEFLRPSLPDAATSKKLAQLLQLRLKLPGIDRGATAKEPRGFRIDFEDGVREGDVLEAGVPSGAVTRWRATSRGVHDAGGG